MTAIDATTLLKQWQDEYNVPDDLLWGGYIELGGSVKDGYRMGQCNYIRYMRNGVWYPRSTIYLDKGMKNAPRYFQECTLYHEFCHGRAYNEDLKDNDHDLTWRKYRREKPKYWIGDLLLKLIGKIWCR